MSTKTNKYEFTVEVDKPNLNYTRVPNALIDDLMHYIKPNHLKIMLIFLRSKADYKFSTKIIADLMGVHPKNMQKTLRQMEKDGLIQFYKGKCHLNIHPANYDLQEKRKMKKENNQNGYKKKVKSTDDNGSNNSASAVINGSKNYSEDQMGVKDTADATVKNTAPNGVKNTAVVSGSKSYSEDQMGVKHTADATVKNTAPINPLKPQENKGIEKDLSHLNNTNDNTIPNSSKDYKEINKENITNNSVSLMGEKNSLELVLENGQFKSIYDYSKWDQYDISNYSDSYIAYLVVENKINNNPTGLDDKKLDSFLFFIVQYALHEDTPPNGLKDAVEYRLRQINQEDQIKKFM